MLHTKEVINELGEHEAILRHAILYYNTRNRQHRDEAISAWAVAYTYSKHTSVNYDHETMVKDVAISTIPNNAQYGRIIVHLAYIDILKLPRKICENICIQDRDTLKRSVHAIATDYVDYSKTKNNFLLNSAKLYLDQYNLGCMEESSENVYKQLTKLYVDDPQQLNEKLNAIFKPQPLAIAEKLEYNNNYAYDIVFLSWLLAEGTNDKDPRVYINHELLYAINNTTAVIFAFKGFQNENDTIGVLYNKELYIAETITDAIITKYKLNSHLHILFSNAK